MSLCSLAENSDAKVRSLDMGEEGILALYLQPLFLRTPVQQFLNEVVAKGVYHQLYQVVQHLREHHSNGGCPAFIKLALKEATAVLILGN